MTEESLNLVKLIASMAKQAGRPLTFGHVAIMIDNLANKRASEAVQRQIMRQLRAEKINVVEVMK